ncbi:MAG: GNAT family N-acetyltransferase [Candidatus Hodarchaeota archaeon]
MEFNIRVACIEDHPHIFELAEATWEFSDYIVEAFPEWVHDPNIICLVAAEPILNKVIGLAAMSFNSEQGWIQGLRTHPEMRRKGIATALVNSLLEHASEIEEISLARMGTAAGQEITKRIARNLGFQFIGKFWGYFLSLSSLQKLATEPELELKQIHPDELGQLLRILEEIPFIPDRRLILIPFAIVPLNLTELQKLSSLGSFWADKLKNVVIYLEFWVEDSEVSIGCTIMKKAEYQPKGFWTTFNKLIRSQLPKNFVINNVKEIALFSNIDVDIIFPGISQYFIESPPGSGIRRFEEIIFEKEI